MQQNQMSPSLQHRFLKDSFEERPSSRDDSYHVVPFLLKQRGEEKKILKLRLQECSNIERRGYKYRDSYFFQNLKCVIICFDITNSSTYDHVGSYFRDMKREIQEDAVIILVSTKSDLAHIREVTYNEISSMLIKCGLSYHHYIECSSIDNQGVKEVFFTAIKMLLNKINSRPLTLGFPKKSFLDRKLLNKSPKQSTSHLPLISSSMTQLSFKMKKLIIMQRRLYPFDQSQGTCSSHLLKKTSTKKNRPSFPLTGLHFFKLKNFLLKSCGFLINAA